ncbi:hypothetical protein DFH28DRAFT_950483, partial [Melampsora americana]
MIGSLPESFIFSILIGLICHSTSLNLQFQVPIQFQPTQPHPSQCSFISFTSTHPTTSPFSSFDFHFQPSSHFNKSS